MLRRVGGVWVEWSDVFGAHVGELLRRGEVHDPPMVNVVSGGVGEGGASPWDGQFVGDLCPIRPDQRVGLSYANVLGVRRGSPHIAA